MIHKWYDVLIMFKTIKNIKSLLKYFFIDNY